MDDVEGEQDQEEKAAEAGGKEMWRDLQPDCKWSPLKRKCCVAVANHICWAAAVKRKINLKGLQMGS